MAKIGKKITFFRQTISKIYSLLPDSSNFMKLSVGHYKEILKR
jgi:hypothetical protein